MLKKFICVAFSVLLLAACSGTSIRQTADFSSEFLKEKHIIALPIEARVTEAGSAHEKRHFDFEYNIENIIAEKIIPAFKKKGMNLSLLKRKDAYDLKINESIKRLDDKIFEIDVAEYKQLETTQENSSKLNAVVVDLTKKLYEIVPADVYVSVRYERSIKSSGSQTLAFAMAMFGVNSGEPADSAKLRIALIDGKTGRVLWMNKNINVHAVFFSSDDKVEEEKQIEKLIENNLKTLEIKRN